MSAPAGPAAASVAAAGADASGTARSAAILGLLTSAMIWGLSWWPLQQLQTLGVHPLWSTCLMFTLIAALITVRRPRVWRVLLAQRDLWLILLVSGTTNTFFNLGVTSGDVVRVVLLFYLMPVWTVPLARLVLHEPVRRAALLRLLIATSGAVVVLWPTQTTLTPWSGADLLGLLAGLGFALNTVLMRKHPEADAGGRALAMFAGSALLGGLLALVLQVPPLPPLQPAWLALTGGMALLFLVGNLGLQLGASALPTSLSAIIMLTEVLWASGSAVWLGAGQLTARLVVGGAMILGSATLAALD